LVFQEIVTPVIVNPDRVTAEMVGGVVSGGINVVALVIAEYADVLPAASTARTR
jgi:hypothetical protein